MVKNSVTNIQIYLNPGLIDLIKTTFFNGPTGFGYKFKQYYVSLHLEHEEPELTIPIVTLGATTVSSIFSLLSGLSLTWMWWYKFFAVLYEWCEGKKGKTSSNSQKGKAEKFKGDNFKRVYDHHIETLMKLKKKTNTYHKFMLELYSKVV